MATFSVFSHFFLVSFAASLLRSDSSLIRVPQSGGAAGVFLLIEGGKYTFNFTAARDACSHLDLAIATRDQMERAVQRGLETCKFGWTAEQIAVIPRLTADSRCGKSKTGVVTWAAGPERMFGVYCFNASDLEENRSTARPQRSTLAPTPAAPSVRSTATFPPSATTETPERTTFTSAFHLLLRTTSSTRIPSVSSQPPEPFSSHVPASPPHFISSKPVVTSTFSTSPRVSSFSESATSRPTSSTKPPLGDVPTALIVLAVILLLLTAAAVVWFYKLNIFASWSRGQQKDDTETEMWKQADSETELQDGDEDEPDRKYSSDITLCVNPDMKTDSQ